MKSTSRCPMMTSLRSLLCAVLVIVLAVSSSAAASTGATLREQFVVAARREALNVDARSRSRGALQPQTKSSKLKPVLIGAAIGGGIGAIYGARYCTADCGGGRPRGVEVFGLAGAAIGAGGGFVVALLIDR
jgi:hypothetical protein